MDDVLEILIKNGELPPSAAQDPATPTTPNRQLQQNLVFTAPADSQTHSLVFTAASPISPISPIAMEVSQSDCVSSPAPAPPPPPPLPLATFSIQLPTALQQLQQQEEISSFNTDLLTSEGDLDAAMLLSPQSAQQSSPDPQPPQEVTSSDNANLDLKVYPITKRGSSSSSKSMENISYWFFISGTRVGPRNSRHDGFQSIGLRLRSKNGSTPRVDGHRWHAHGHGRSRLAGFPDASVSSDCFHGVESSASPTDKFVEWYRHLRPVAS